MSKEYSWTENQTDDIWNHGKFDSVEACINDAISYGKKPGEKIVVGICEDYVPHLSADTLLDQVSENAYEEVGEVAEGWPEFVDRKGYRDADKLQEKIDKAFYEWMEETKQVPGFYCIVPLAESVIIPDKKN
ncbi:MAG: hypothetical protein HFG84_07615 [Dorea sp.]|jgi:hypothetical protein|nr:hypothetical protein [Dorea sp.]